MYIYIQDRIGALGACELVVRVVDRYIDSPHFLTRCCSVVLALSELERVDEEGNHLHIWKYECCGHIYIYISCFDNCSRISILI